MTKKPKATKPGIVQKIIKSTYPQEPEKAEIAVEGADDLYREIRIANNLEDEKGKKVKLKEGAHVDVTIEANPSETIPAGSK
jgi:predicted DNA-binding antitoxin AbrB/MazE fold protein